MNENIYDIPSILIDPEWFHAYKSIIEQTFEIPFYICSNGIRISSEKVKKHHRQTK